MEINLGLGTLTILFVVLKLTDNIDWSWFWVLSPMIIPLAIVVLFLAFAGLIKIFSR